MTLDRTALNDELLTFVRTAPTPYHATAALVTRLEAAGFTALQAGDIWQLRAGGRYYITRNASSLIAFTTGTARYAETGWRMVGAHTDSPCLKIKPNAVTMARGYARLGVEVYGGALLNPWFDRDLGLAGRLHVRRADGRIAAHLINIERPIAVIPSLAIHLDREVNQKRSINAQNDLPALLARGEVNLPTLLLQQLYEQTPGADAMEVVDFELSLYDLQPPALIGLQQEFIASARLDNLVSCVVAIRSLIDSLGDSPGASNRHSSGDTPRLVVLSDHEEVGSVSGAGAQGPFLEEVLARLTDGAQALGRAVATSLLISADNAHAVHPNFPDKHDEGHGPVLNGGPVLKVNANQRYASTSETQALFRDLCHRADVPMQVFVTRSDMACGSTIGPITAARIGVRTVDVGVPQLAMHSIRELCGAHDPHYLYRALQEFFTRDSV